MKKEIKNAYSETLCFFCGKDNPIGLKLAFYLDDETGQVSTTWHSSTNFTGLGRVLHGGIQSGLFDEIMGWTTHTLCRQMGVTLDLNVKFVKPVYTDTTLRVTCKIVSRDRAKVHLSARIEDETGTVCSTATGTYYLMDEDRFNRLVKKEVK